MCSPYVLAFGTDNLSEAEIKGKRVLEVGSRNVNGSLREHVESFHPAEYIGVDLELASGVDKKLNAEHLVKEFGEKSFDVVISTEMLEHAVNWKAIISNMKQVLKPGGALLVTTRSQGFPFHEYPVDAWRFEVDDMKAIFADMEDVKVEPDPFEPGVFVKATKPKRFKEADLSDFELYSVPKDARVK